MGLYSIICKRIIVSAMLLIPGATASAEVEPLPDLGSSARVHYSEKDERKLGRQTMIQVRRSLAFVDDPELSAYVQTLGNRLAKHDGNNSFQFFLIRDPTINAFAIPGGYIGLHTGLIVTTKNEAELAAIFAHEIVHVNQQHWSRMMAARKQRSGLTAAALLASVILAGSGQPIGEAGIALTAAANLSSELSFSRAFEQEADRLGIQLLAKAGYKTDSMADFFERLQKSHRLTDSGGPEYLRTHPITTNRIAEARDRARKNAGQNSSDQQAFLFAKARILALYSKNSEQAKSLLKSIISAQSHEAYLYGQALVFLRTNNKSQAANLVRTLRKKHPTSLRYLMLDADNQLKSGRTLKGLSLYSMAYRKAPKRRDIMLRYARALINHRSFEKAYQILKTARNFPPQYPHLQKLFAQAAGETGRLVESHQSMAEFYYLQGNTAAALQQLRIARNRAGKNKYSLARIEARKKEFELKQ